MKELSLLAV